MVDPPAGLSEVRSRVSALESELSVRAERLKSSQEELMQSKKELATSELSLQRVRDQLTLAHTRIAQESERVIRAVAQTWTNNNTNNSSNQTAVKGGTCSILQHQHIIFK